MAFQFYLDGQLTDQPVNDTELTTKIDRSAVEGNVTVTQEVTLRWAATNNLASGLISGYAYLSTLLYDRICNEAEIKVYDVISPTDTALIYTGVIKVPTITVDLHRMILSTKIQDNSFYSYIKNNMNIKVKFDATRTKNLLYATPLDHYEMTMIQPGPGGTMGGLYKVYEINEVISHILFCITDNKVTYSSTYLSTLDFPLYICKGQNLTNPISAWPDGQGEMEMSLEEVLTELNRFYNLAFWIDSSDPANPVMRIEDWESLFAATTVHTIAGIKEMSLEVPTDHLYGIIKVGDENYIAPPCATCYFNHTAGYYGWRNVEFFPMGQCNIDTELDLTSKWVIDNNAITDTLIGMNTAHLDTTFAIEGDPSTVDTIFRTVTAMAHPFFVIGEYYLNEGLNNINKLKRHASKFETNFGNFLETTDDTFKAYLGYDATDNISYVTSPASATNFLPVAGATVEPFPFVNTTTMDAFNYDGNYNTASYRYSIPSTGDYSFNAYIEWTTAGIMSLEAFTVTATIVHYDAANNVLFTDTAYLVCNGNGSWNINLNYVAYATATDYIQVRLRVVYQTNGVQQQITARTITFMYDSFFRCMATATSGVSIYSSNPMVRKYLYSMTAPIPHTQWTAIINNPIGLVAFEKDDVTKYGWIAEAKRDDWTGITNLKLLTNNALTQD